MTRMGDLRLESYVVNALLGIHIFVTRLYGGQPRSRWLTAGVNMHNLALLALVDGLRYCRHRNTSSDPKAIASSERL